MSDFKVGDRVMVISKPAAEEFHGRLGTVVRVNSKMFVGVTVFLDNDDRNRSWTSNVFRKLTKLERALS